MRRRQFLGVLGGALVFRPLGARAQQPHVLPIVGLVSIGASADDPANFRPFLKQISELGYVDGSSIIFEKRIVQFNLFIVSRIAPPEWI